MKSYLNLVRVLYVEDEEDIREELEEFLEFRVKNIYVATDGEEGLKAYKEYKPDIVLSDIKMPNMDGLQMSKEIKSINRDTPIVVATAFSDPTYLMKSIEIGVDKYVTKPINPDLLIEALEDVAKIVYRAKELEKKQLELKELNESLQERVKDEVSKNRQKDRVLELQSRQAQMGEMISAIAHQWKQPLNIISIAVTNLSFNYELDENITKEDIYELEESVSKQVKYMSQTLDEFRDFFKPSKEKIEFSIKEAIQKVLNLIDAQYTKQNINININGDESIKISGYPNEFEQVIINILNNARDAMVEKNIENKRVDIDIFRENDKSIVTISDSAGGIDESVIDEIFEPYVTTKSDDKGTGIGLYMSKTIINKIDGDISVENIENGAKFTIKIKV